VIYANKIIRSNGEKTRYLQLNAKKNTHIREEIARLVASGALAEAKRVFEAEEAEKERQRDEAQRQNELVMLRELAAKHGYILTPKQEADA
jgi:hypothetical protein